MHNLKITIAYDGSNYLGWQKTIEGPSIEESLQRVLEQIFQQPMRLQAASRTDAGVHAVGQVVNCLPKTLRPTPERLRISLNMLLPGDIRIIDIELAQESFHPTLDCKEKEYHYWICNSPVQLPQNRLYSWHVHTPLDLAAMDQAASILAGTHDFAAFCNAIQETEYENTIRTIHSLEVIRHSGQHPGQRLQLKVRGSNFLYRMVRNLAGTLVDIGRGKTSLDNLEPILAKGKRAEAGLTAPAHGLTLFRVYY